ncbi:uncharacterized protein LOC8258603 [Ricinus communis]|uniref:DUF1677 domain-containing protein n=1 Tax=Ricinus communis TaxID=3988 RepID=B9RQY7_RICCO|nr:uncharacterized protein LOC8258603 [Ricinus communis]EEF46158.1 conserved hypothetical protein [Ricinus communis]|eukprot:XP_025012617.1 uncharacterized protein LOC8258603 [Ricinus communis]
MSSEAMGIKHNNAPAAGLEIENTKCECCGFTEECTASYIARVRERCGGRWICGLCEEAVKDESYRLSKAISVSEALELHMKFCQQFKSSIPPINPTGKLISAVKLLIRRSLDSPRKKNGSVFLSSSSSSFSCEFKLIN